jgi:hypothetical protein
MPELIDKRKIAEAFKRELEDASISRPDWALDHAGRSSGESGVAVIPKPILDAILEVIAKSIEQALADVMTRCVGEGIEKGMRPFAMELSLLRIAIEHEWDGANRRRRNSPHDDDDFEE